MCNLSLWGTEWLRTGEQPGGISRAGLHPNLFKISDGPCPSRPNQQCNNSVWNATRWKYILMLTSPASHSERTLGNEVTN
ncbi:hypothetical protein AAFF_G00242180 [Aldrovandia affinis]|uniref:Uncharacterized protein n=1 Tax=Aldrovandia affinis TaxID=143900 RepID=A0AAD7WU06_9TELE|nr:hypothetical protein AAFF_G00242180 [Aldrovandia affinis]